jgi:REP element-mobilizing transposase RayT
MPNYRRAFVPGGCWFFTVNLLERRQTLLVSHIHALRDATERTRKRYPFVIDAVVVLPDHIHAVWTLPPKDADFSVRWRLIKVAVRSSAAEARTPQRCTQGTQRTRHLAAAILGASDQG